MSIHDTESCTCICWLRPNARHPEDFYTRRDPYCAVHGRCPDDERQQRIDDRLTGNAQEPKP